jgi:hypothetical protein
LDSGGVATAPLLDLVVAMDDALVQELRAHPRIVGYCTCKLANSEYGNLVLLRDEAAKTEWAKSTRHRYVARPHWLEGGLAQPHSAPSVTIS